MRRSRCNRSVSARCVSSSCRSAFIFCASDRQKRASPNARAIGASRRFATRAGVVARVASVGIGIESAS
jgi:hypothetical protein